LSLPVRQSTSGISSCARGSCGITEHRDVKMVPLSTMEAGFRLMLHGLDAENLCGFVKSMRDQ
jgi:hypothetical protein